MAFTRFNSAEGGTNGVTVTAASSGGASGYAFDSARGVFPVFSTDTAWTGTFSYKCVTTASQCAPVWIWNGPGTGDIYTRVAINVSTFAGNLTTTDFAGAGSYGYTQINTSGHPVINGANTGTVTGTGTAMTTGSWYIIEQHTFQHATNGYSEMWLSDAAGNPLDHVKTVTPGSTIGITQIWLGLWSNWTGTAYLDGLAVSDQSRIGSTTSFTLAKSNTAEGQAASTALTVANSGGLSGDAIDITAGATLTFDNAQVHNGSMAYKFVKAASDPYIRWNVPGTSLTVNLRAYVYFSGAPFNTYIFADLSTLHIVTCNGTHWTARAFPSSLVTGTTTPVANTWYLIEGQFFYDASAAAVVARIYDNSGNLLETITATGGTNAVPSLLYLGGAGSSATGTMWLDNIAVSDQGWIGNQADIIAGPAALPVPVALPAPVITSSSVAVTATRLTVAATFPDAGLPVAVTTAFPAVTASGSATASPSAVAVSAAFPVSAPSGSAAASPAALPVTAALPAATVTPGPAVLAVSAAVPVPTVTPGPAVLAVTTTFPAAAPSGSASASPDALVVSATALAPTVTPGPAALAASAVVPAAAVSPGPAVLAVSAVVPAAVVSPSPAALATAAAFPTVTVTPGPAVLAVSTAIPAPTAAGSAASSPVVLTVTTALPVPSMTVSAAVSPVTLIVPVSAPAPVVRQDRTVAPATVTAAAAFPACAITIHAVIAPAVLAVTSIRPAVLVHTGSTSTPPVIAAPLLVRPVVVWARQQGGTITSVTSSAATSTTANLASAGVVTTSSTVKATVG